MLSRSRSVCFPVLPSATVLAALLVMSYQTVRAEDSEVWNVWPERPPGKLVELPPEADTTTDSSNKVAGRRLIRLGNVSTPQIEIFQPPADKANGASVVICPGGGHHILAYDLEGTEVAEWLNTLGVTGIVLKYRVPAQDPKQRWIEAVQDAQRAMSLVRANAEKLKLDPNRIGICGFSAGGETAALTSLFLDDRKYETIDEIDAVSCRPNFSLLIYPAYLADKETGALQEYIHVSPETPPAFFVHAYDDGVTPLSSLVLATEMKKAGASAEVHMYSKGGHGYGLRPTDLPITHWPEPCAAWLKQLGVLEKKNP
ncbi:MAG: alpha/beta hydrolase [Planctomycetaceae bacterium]